MDGLTHLDERGRARMVDVGDKPETPRRAVARGCVFMQRQTLALIARGEVAKGDVLAVARVAGILAAKETGRLIPLCHPIPLTVVRLDFRLDEAARAVEIEAVAETVGRTGVEMEALTAVATAALTIYDMCKAVDPGMIIGDIYLAEKSGGRGGPYRRDPLKPRAGISGLGQPPWEGADGDA